MLKKTIKYEDYNGKEVEEDFYFNLSKAELIELEASHKDGLSEAMQRILAAEDSQAIVKEFKNIVLMSIGKKSPDGTRFNKSQEIRDDFESSAAFPELFMELVTDADAASAFIRGILPHDMEIPDTPEEPVVAKPEPIRMTEKDVRELPPGEYARLSDRIIAGEVMIVEDPV